MPKPRKKTPTNAPPTIDTTRELREELRRRGIASRVGIPAMPTGATDDRRVTLPQRKVVAE